MTFAPATRAAEVKSALYQLTVDLFKDDPKVTVSFGHPGTRDLGQDLIVFLDVVSRQDPATLGSSHSRNEDLEVDVGISSIIPGVEDDQEPTLRAYWLLGQIEQQIRSVSPTLGDLVLWCFLTEHQSKGATPPEQLPNGRIVYLLARFTAQVRIR